MKRILIVGRSGSGKTTFSNKLGEKLTREVIHLDNLFWKPGWVRAFTPEEWEFEIQKMIQKEEWIIEGNYHNTLEIRLKRADAVIFFDTNPFVALAYALKRKFFPPKKSTDISGLHDEVKVLTLAKSIFNFPTSSVRDQIVKAGIKDVFVIRNRREAKKILNILANKI